MQFLQNYFQKRTNKIIEAQDYELAEQFMNADFSFVEKDKDENGETDGLSIGKKFFYLEGIFLDLTDTPYTFPVYWNDTAPNSSVFTLGNYNGGNDDDVMIAYCFAEKKGFSKFGSYTGNGSLDGTFIYTGFKPAWVVIKRTDAINSWVMFDNKRDGTYGLSGNPRARHLYTNTSDPEDSADNYNKVDFVSNGFKVREDNTTINASGGTYIYMAFAEEPLVGDNPATAR